MKKGLRSRLAQYGDEEFALFLRRGFLKGAGFTDEAKFDAFRKTLTWEGHSTKIKVPYLCVTGEHDELSPIVYSERMLKGMTNPRLFVVYQDARHAIGACPSVNMGPHPPTLVADWMVARLAGKPMASERWFIENSGNVIKTPL